MFLALLSSTPRARESASLPDHQSHIPAQATQAAITATSPYGIRSASRGGGASGAERSSAGLSHSNPPSARPRLTASGVGPGPSTTESLEPSSVRSASLMEAGM